MRTTCEAHEQTNNPAPPEGNSCRPRLHEHHTIACGHTQNGHLHTDAHVDGLSECHFVVLTETTRKPPAKWTLADHVTPHQLQPANNRAQHHTETGPVDHITLAVQWHEHAAATVGRGATHTHTHTRCAVCAAKPRATYAHRRLAIGHAHQYNVSQQTPMCHAAAALPRLHVHAPSHTST